MDLHSESQRTIGPDELDRREPLNVEVAHELVSYQHALSAHVGEALVNIDTALQMVDESRWSPETQSLVRREIGAELISGFIEGSGLDHASPRSLESEARMHLARFAIAASLLLTQREARARVSGEAQPCAG